MSKCELLAEKDSKVDGVTLFSKDGTCMKPTGVYLPPIHKATNKVNVVLWMHGFYVHNIRFLFQKDHTFVRQAVLDSKKDVVLIAPFLGYKDKDKSGAWVGEYGVGELGGHVGCQRYLEQVLQALADNQGISKIEVDNLILAGHSAGGGSVKTVSGALGTFDSKAKEFWGFDCLYGAASKWDVWVRGLSGAKVYFYFGDGTKPSDNADVLGVWKLGFGTTSDPIQASARVRNMFLAPALPGAEVDLVAFQTPEEIQKKARAANPYEIARAKLDPLLDDPKKYWPALLPQVKHHYQVASELLCPRLKQTAFLGK